MGRYLVCDIGGTSIRYAIYSDADKTLSNWHKISTGNLGEFLELPEGESSTEWVRRLVETVREGVPAPHEFERAVIGFPGPISPEKVLYRIPTVMGAKQGAAVNLTEVTRAIWPEKPIAFINDVTAAGYYYKERMACDFCIVTVGSGIGCKVFIDGKPVTGPGGRGGEIGHLKVMHDSNAPICDCGERGHLGAISSGRGVCHHFIQSAKRNPLSFERSLLAQLCSHTSSSITNEMIVTAFHAGDAWTLDNVRFTAGFLARVLAGIFALVGVEKFVIGGGFGVALGERYLGMLAEIAADEVWSLGAEWDKMLMLGSAPDEVGLLGAGYFASLGVHNNAST
jgi:C7-cyclitol 7-kinase